MQLSKENRDYIYNFIENELKFLPDCHPNSPFLPFSLNRPFAVYDISNLTDAQGDLLHELMPTILANCLPQGHQLYAIDWFHSFVLYDPHNIEQAQSDGFCSPQLI